MSSIGSDFLYRNINEVTATEFILENSLIKYIPKSLFYDEIALKDDAKINVFFIGFTSTNYEILKKLCLHNHIYVYKDGKYDFYKFEYSFINYNASNGEKNLFKDFKNEMDEIFKNKKQIKNFSFQNRSMDYYEKKIESNEFNIVIVALGDDYYNYSFCEENYVYNKSAFLVKIDEPDSYLPNFAIPFGEHFLSSIIAKFMDDKQVLIGKILFRDINDINILKRLVLELHAIYNIFDFTISFKDEFGKEDYDIVSKDDYLSKLLQYESLLNNLFKHFIEVYSSVYNIKNLDLITLNFEKIYEELQKYDFWIVNKK